MLYRFVVFCLDKIAPNLPLDQLIPAQGSLVVWILLIGSKYMKKKNICPFYKLVLCQMVHLLKLSGCQINNQGLGLRSVYAFKPESPAENLCHPVDCPEQTHQD